MNPATSTITAADVTTTLVILGGVFFIAWLAERFGTQDAELVLIGYLASHHWVTLEMMTKDLARVPPKRLHAALAKLVQAGEVIQSRRGGHYKLRAIVRIGEEKCEASNGA